MTLRQYCGQPHPDERERSCILTKGHSGQCRTMEQPPRQWWGANPTPRRRR